MIEGPTVVRMLRAAEAWARSHYRQELVAQPAAEPRCCPDDTVELVVDLEDSAPTGRKRARCMVVMEPDGRIACTEAWADSREHA